MQIKPLLTILFCSLLISCADPGEEYVTVKKDDNTKVVKISDVRWVKSTHYNYRNTWQCTGNWHIENPEDAKKVDSYKSQ